MVAALAAVTARRGSGVEDITHPRKDRSHLRHGAGWPVGVADLLLAASPKQSAATGKSPLDSAMDNSGGGAGIANNGGDEEEQAHSNDGGGLLGAYTAATGNKAVLRVVK